MTINGIQGGSSGIRMRLEKPAPLTSDQQEQVASILSEFDSSNLAVEDAQAIHQSFKDAGIRPAPGLKEAIEEAGFDPEVLRSLDPPPQKSGAGGPPPSGQGGGINRTALQSLQEILSEYDFSDMSSDTEYSLLEQLRSAGLIVQGNILDISA